MRRPTRPGPGANRTGRQPAQAPAHPARPALSSGQSATRPAAVRGSAQPPAGGLQPPHPPACALPFRPARRCLARFWAVRRMGHRPHRANPVGRLAPVNAVFCPFYFTCISTNHVEEIKELEAQVLSLKKGLEKHHEGKSALDKMLSVQQSPNDKSGLGFNSNNKNKSKSKSNKKKGQDKVDDPAKLVCFKCKVEGHHVRSCPLKKKKKHLSEKQQGKRPQGQGQAHARPQVEDRPLPKKNQDIVPQEKKSIKKRKGNTCYLCREKGHFASSCLSGTLSNPIIVDDDYSLGKDKDGNVFAKFVGTQSGFKKRTIWVAKPIVTNLLGPNLVGDQQAQT
ncbi:hypothetical protein QYE76_036197 [Lolium multiflorum]|uniref:CCHC-type domain-containing protein n=1 Tax=Lolium multiflorum TaxID=4521 RepID=A0AAD8R3Z4_LOLMU|nr:hypothetical protein QYE76_036197 [Lolium multiflorum]